MLSRIGNSDDELLAAPLACARWQARSSTHRPDGTLPRPRVPGQVRRGWASLSQAWLSRMRRCGTLA